MKFSNVLLFATTATAMPAIFQRAPAAEVAKPAVLQDRDLLERQTTSSSPTAIDTLTQALNDLNTALGTSVSSASSAIAGVAGNVGAGVAVQVQAQLLANFQAIASALQSSGAALATAWSNVISNLGGNLTGVSAQQIQSLVTAVSGTLNLLGQLTSLLVSASSTLPANVQTLLQSQVANIQSFITGLLGPLSTFITSVGGSTTFASNLPTFLVSATKIVIQLVNSLGASLGSLNLGNLGSALNNVNLSNINPNNLTSITSLVTSLLSNIKLGIS